MAANGLAASYTDLQGEVALALGWKRSPGSWSSTEDGDFLKINKAAYRQAVYPEPLAGERVGHVWSWLRPKGTLTLNIPYTTGTVAIAADVAGSIVTGTGTSFPTWAAAGDLWVNNSRYSVLSRSSGTALRLDNVSVTVSAGATYQLIQHDYDLASDFGGMESNAFTYRRDQTPCWEIKIVGEGDLRRMDRASSATGTPAVAAILPVAPNATDDARWQASFYPIPTTAYELEYRYVAIPPLLTGTGTAIYHYGGAPYSNLFIASYRERAFKLIRDSDEGLEDYERALRSAVMYDRANHAWHTLGRGPNSYGQGKFDLESATRFRREGTVAGIEFDALV